MSKKYTEMTSAEKVVYNVDKITEQLKALNVPSGCSYGHKYCIDCGLGEIVNHSKKLQAIIDSFYDTIKHGDEEHQKWLKDKVQECIDGGK